VIQKKHFEDLEDQMLEKSEALSEMSDEQLWEKEYNATEDWHYDLEVQLSKLNSEYREDPRPEKKAEVRETYEEWKSVGFRLEYGEVEIDYLQSQREELEDELDKLINKALSDAWTFIEQRGIECDFYYLEETYEKMLRETFESREYYGMYDYGQGDKSLFEHSLREISEDYESIQTQTSDEYIIYENDAGQLLKAVRTEAVSQDPYNFSLECVLLIDLDSDIPEKMIITSMPNTGLSKVINFESKGE